MKKFARNITISFLTLITGIGSVWFYKTIDLAAAEKSFDESVLQQTFDPKPTARKLYFTQVDGEIKIDFVKFSFTKDEVFAEFEVINHNNQPTSYWAYPQNDDDDLVDALPQFKINGFHNQIWHCGSGQKEFELSPGESKIFKLSSHSLNDYVNKSGQNIQVGYWFTYGKNKQGKLFWSDEFLIPDSVKAQLKLEEIEWEKETNNFNLT